MLVKDASLKLMETQVLFLPVEFAQCGHWQCSQHPHRYFSTLIRWKPEQQVPLSPFPFSSDIEKVLMLLSHEKMLSVSKRRPRGLWLCSPGSLVAACLLGTPVSLCFCSSTAATVSLLPMRRPRCSPLPFCSYLLLSIPFVHRHSILQPTVLSLHDSADQTQHHKAPACEGSEFSDHLLRQVWQLGTRETYRLCQVERCKRAVPCASRMYIYLNQ